MLPTTVDNHFLHKGEVSRIIYRSADGAAYHIRTAAPGDGPWGFFNVELSETIWGPIDERVIQAHRQATMP